MGTKGYSEGVLKGTRKGYFSGYSQVLVELGAEHATAGAFKEGGIQPLISLLWSENEAEQREVRGNMYVHVHVHKAYVDIYACVYVS